MDIIPGDVNSRFLVIHVMLMLLGLGAWCTAVTLWRKCSTFSSTMRLALLAVAYVGAGILYLITLQSRTYREFAHGWPVAGRVFEAPVWLFCAVDYVLAPHAGGTALHALTQ